jgi:hypothetical protein
MPTILHRFFPARATCWLSVTFCRCFETNAFQLQSLQMHPKILIKRHRSRKVFQNHHRKSLDESITRITVSSESEASNQDEPTAKLPQNASHDNKTSLQAKMSISGGSRTTRSSCNNDFSLNKYRYNFCTRKMRRRNAINFLATDETSDTLATSLFTLLIHSA